jgi:putative FmdB family regulatory protein
MPTYDYECDACGHKQEIFQNISEPLLEKCPKCKKKKFRRLFGAGAAIVFKGSGFYTTDYRSDSYKQAATAESKSSESAPSASSDGSPSKSESSKSESSKSEAKPAAKTESSPAPSTPTKPAKKSS